MAASGKAFSKITDETDACYVIAETSSSSITIKVFNVNSKTDYYFRVLVRLLDDVSDKTYDQTFLKSGDHSYMFVVSNLESGTDYIMNFGEAINSQGVMASDDDWWGTTEFFTATTTAPTINTPTINEKKVSLPWRNRTRKSAKYLIVSNNYIKEYGSVSSSSTTNYADLTFDNYDTTYTVYIYTIASNGRSNFNSISFKTGPEYNYEDVDIEITDWVANGNIVTIEVEVLAGEVDYFKIAVGTTDKTAVTEISYSEGYYYFEIPFNKFGTSYTVTITAYGLEGETDPDKVTITTESLTKWNWNNYNSSTGWSESDALSGKGPFNTITSDRWKKFIAFYNGVTEAAKAAGIITKAFVVNPERTDILTANDFWGLVTESNSTFIDAGLTSYYTRPSEDSIQTGKPVYGYYITDLTTAYNKLIDYIS